MKLEAVKLTYTQDADSCADCHDDLQTLDIEVADAGGGPYLVIGTPRWALDEEDIDRLAGALRSALAMIEGDA